MIGTRDFFLYVVVFTFLVMGIIFTINNQPGNFSSANTVSGPEFSETQSLQVTSASEQIDRAANIASLKRKLAEGSQLSSDKAPVFTSVDSVLADATGEFAIATTSEIANGVAEREAEYCISPGQEILLAAWPNSERITNEVISGWRTYSMLNQREQAVGSSTAIITEKQTLLQIPVVPFRGLSANCLDSSMVGVAADGSPILNNETWRFRTVPANSVIGYARDGFPIISSIVDESVLDSCGGYDNGVSYQYYVRSTETFVLGCFAAQPQPLL